LSLCNSQNQLMKRSSSWSHVDLTGKRSSLAVRMVILLGLVEFSYCFYMQVHAAMHENQ